MTKLLDTSNSYSPVVHYLAVSLVCVTFPLIWVGGLVTTYDAGMAVPDWPGTFGDNLFLFPWDVWLAAPWDLFIEHGHRLLGATAGLLAIGFVIAVFAFDRRLSLRFHAQTALALVIGQGVLGGQRVLLDARHVALIHGCVGPLFFAYCACLAVITSRRWLQQGEARSAGSSLTRWALVGTLLALGQLVLGAHLRHPADDGSPRLFRIVLLFHVVVAVALVAQGMALAWSAWRTASTEQWITRPTAWLAVLLAGQIALGVCTLIVKYGWPAWLGGEVLNPHFTVIASGFWSSMIVTAHVATGSLILATFAVTFVRAQRCFGFVATSPTQSTGKRESPDHAEQVSRLSLQLEGASG